MTPSASSRPSVPHPHSTQVIALVMVLFFAFGFCTVLVDSLVPKLRGLFALSYTRTMLIQLCFFGAYFIMSLPAARLIARVGYLQSVAVGLLVMAAGCLAFTPAAEQGSYAGFLLALFTLASGVTILQVAVNPLATAVGDPQRAPARLTLAQAFNSLATTVSPLFGAAFILREAAPHPDIAQLSASALIALRQAEGRALQGPFLLLCGVLGLLAVVCWCCRHWAPPASQGTFGLPELVRLLDDRRLRAGTVAIFLYVGAEVSIGSMAANYLMQPAVLGLNLQAAGSLVAVYWGLAMVGRFVGASLLRRANPGLLLGLFGCAAVLLATLAIFRHGPLAAAALLGIGLCDSIMFPTIFSLALEGVPERAAQASGVLCLAIVGGAVVPMCTGIMADATSLNQALWVPVLCYLGIVAFGWSARVPVTRALPG